MFSTDFIFRQQENLVDNQKCWAGFRPLCNKILFPMAAMSLALGKICLYIMRKMRLIHKGLPWYIEKFPDVYWREISTFGLL